MTSPSAFIREDREKLKKIAKKIRFVPYAFSGNGRTVDLNKVNKILNNYK